MAVVNPQTVSDNLKYPGKLSAKEKTELKKNFGNLWQVMAAGNIIPPKSFQARTVNFEYVPKDKKDLSLFAGWLEFVLNTPTKFNKSTLKLEVGKASKITINFKEKKDPQESRKQTPTKIQEKGTTDVFNRVLAKNKRYNA